MCIGVTGKYDALCSTISWLEVKCLLNDSDRENIEELICNVVWMMSLYWYKREREMCSRTYIKMLYSALFILKMLPSIYVRSPVYTLSKKEAWIPLYNRCWNWTCSQRPSVTHVCLRSLECSTIDLFCNFCIWFSRNWNR